LRRNTVVAASMIARRLRADRPSSSIQVLSSAPADPGPGT
jgi:hypothetical protein